MCSVNNSIWTVLYSVYTCTTYYTHTHTHTQIFWANSMWPSTRPFLCKFAVRTHKTHFSVGVGVSCILVCRSLGRSGNQNTPAYNKHNGYDAALFKGVCVFICMSTVVCDWWPVCPRVYLTLTKTRQEKKKDRKKKVYVGVNACELGLITVQARYIKTANIGIKLRYY